MAVRIDVSSPKLRQATSAIINSYILSVDGNGDLHIEGREDGEGPAGMECACSDLYMFADLAVVAQNPCFFRIILEQKFG